MNDQQSGTQSDNKSFFLIHRKTLTEVGNNIITAYPEANRVNKSNLSNVNVKPTDGIDNSKLTYSHFYSKFGPKTNGNSSNYSDQSCIVKSNSAGIKTTMLAYGDRLDYDISSIESADLYATNDINYMSTFQFARHPNITAFVGMNLIRISSEVFINSYLIYVEIDGMEELPAECFAHSRNLEYVSLGSRLKSIPTGCFISCPKLVYIELPKTCTSIGSMAFRDCSKLRMIDGIEHVTTLGDDALYGTNVRYVEICTGFSGRTTFNGSITRSNVEAVYVNNIHPYFDVLVSDCPKMNTIIVGSNVTEIETLAKNTEKFKEIIFEGITTPKISNTLVEGYSNLAYIHHPIMKPLNPNTNMKLDFRLCGPTISMRYYSPPNYSQEIRDTFFDNVSRLEFLSVNANNGFQNWYLPNSVGNVRVRKDECQNEDTYMSGIYSTYSGPKVHYY